MKEPVQLSDLEFRAANEGDVAAIVGLLAADPLGAQRERSEEPLPKSYRRAFEAIAADPNQNLVVACAADAVVGVLQLTFIPYLTYQGGWRAQIEGVRVAESWRSSGVGRALFEWAIARAEERGCHLVQLTTDAQRPDALRFYESFGFRATHHGLKLHLTRGAESP